MQLHQTEWKFSPWSTKLAENGLSSGDQVPIRHFSTQWISWKGGVLEALVDFVRAQSVSTASLGMRLKSTPSNDLALFCGNNDVQVHRC
jgi:hypothetical protein